MTAEDSVRDILTRATSATTAEFLLGCLREQWLAREADKSECMHTSWRYTYNDPGGWNKCDGCGKYNVTVAE